MKIQSLRELQDRLERWRNMQECLLHEIASNDGLYTLDIVFNCTWEDGSGRVVRDESLPPRLVRIRCTGVEELRFQGDLNGYKRAHPERITWGISEVADVQAVEHVGRLGLNIRWEGKGGRGIDVYFVSCDFIEPPEESD